MQKTHLRLMAVTLLSVAACARAGDAAIDIGNRWELLIDHYLIDRMEGTATLRLHKPVAREVVMVHDQPWEGNTSGYHTVFRDGELYRMYYRGWGHDKEADKQLHPAVVCYAESNDGIHWTKPVLGIVEFQGSSENNIIIGDFGTHNFTPFKDTNPDCPPEARYKAVARGEGDDKGKLFAFQSADAIDWKRLQPKPIITDGAFDSQNLTFWDALRGEYRCYFRDFRAGYRDIKTSTSPDFVHWSEPRWLRYGDAPKEHLYTNQIQPYYRAPHILLGFPTRYIPDRGSLTEGLLMSSRDGLEFHRRREAIIRPGRNPDKWYNRSNYIWLGLVETGAHIQRAGTELSLYSNESYYKGQGARTRRYTYRIDGFVSLHARMAGGEMITKPLLFEGNALVLNVSTSAAGSVRVEIQNEAGNPIEGYRLRDCTEIYGDDIERTVEWRRNDVAQLAGRVVRLRFVLRDADVFAFGFKDLN